MANLRLLVVDDDLNSSKPYFEKLFFDQDELDVEYSETWGNFCQARLERFSAILLDINLDKWGQRLHSALAVIGERAPVILVSRWWHLADTHRHISEALAGAKRAKLIGTLALDLLDAAEWHETAKGMARQLTFVVTRERNFTALQLDQADELNILHISDPQYGDPNTELISSAAEQEISRFVKDTLRKPIHIVAITGDITYSGQPNEYIEAEKRTKTLLERFFPNRDDWRERVLLVPGNHDVDLKASAADMLKLKFPTPPEEAMSISVDPSCKSDEHGQFGLRGFLDYAFRITEDNRYLTSKLHLVVNESFSRLGVRFIMLNTVIESSARSPRDFSIGREALDQLFALDPGDESLFTIVMGHHGPAISPVDQEGIGDWIEVLKGFQAANVRLFLHGHGHERRTDIIDTRGVNSPRRPKGMVANHEVVRVMAPTTHLNGKLRPPSESRGFNVISLKRRYGKVEAIGVDHYELDQDVPHRSKAGIVSLHI